MSRYVNAIRHARFVSHTVAPIVLVIVRDVCDNLHVYTDALSFTIIQDLFRLLRNYNDERAVLKNPLSP